MSTRRIASRVVTRTMLALVVLLACATALADPPTHVARLAIIEGPVSFSPAGEEDWVLATLNRPIITGDRLWADVNARTELQLGSLVARLGGQTSVVVLNLDDRITQLQLQQGALNLRVRRLDADETIEVDTPLLAFSIGRAGTYRIDVDAASGATTVAVRSGEGVAYGDGPAYTIGDRQWYRFWDAALRDYEHDALPPYDAFDAWASARDRREETTIAARYVSPDVIGVADLDQYGAWSSVEGYGNVWVPTSVASDWAPYRDGRWVWVEPWGWTWVDAAPWGFAPFHYGRWAYARERWCWVPGPPRARAVYAPALVVFVGGSDFRVEAVPGGGARGVAWFPLAPGEVYRPSYRVSRDYFTNVNVSNTNIASNVVIDVYSRPEVSGTVYRNREQRGGVTAVSAATFAQSRPVAQSTLPVARELATAAPLSSVAPIAPVRASVLGDAGSVSGNIAAGGPARQPPVSRPPPLTLQRPAVARVAPPPAPLSFAAREAALGHDPGRPADPGTPVAPRAAATNASPTSNVRVLGAAQPGVAPPAAPTLPRARTNISVPPSVPPSLPSVPSPGGTSTVPPPASPATPVPKSGAGTPAAGNSNAPPALRPPPATIPLQGEVRRERPLMSNETMPAPVVPSAPPRREVRPPAPPLAPADTRHDSAGHPLANPPVVPAVPAARPLSPPVLPAAAQPIVRPPEAKSPAAKSDAPKARIEEKREEPK